MSRIRQIYMVRFVGRCLVFILCAALAWLGSDAFEVVQGGFFRRFSPLHLLWLVWMGDMLLQLIPAKKDLALGSKKLFSQYFKPVREKIDLPALKRYILGTTKAAYKIFIIWAGLIALLGSLYARGILNTTGLFMISAAFYVCDLICVLFWCPFRLLMKNRCCTTCRIFNWDHLMMFTPMLFVGSFYTLSLLAMAVVVWMAWEFSVLIHPERFWYMSNKTLQCAACTDKLCTQYCQKLRTKK